ncbi:MAG: SusC/RagA family TonB-linked outer membrane protein, partial [Polaribacter sp.]
AGDLKFIDHNNDGRINDEDRVTVGSAFPDITYAFNADLNYKNFDMRIFLQGVSGSSAYNGFKLTTVYPNQTSVGPEANLSADAIDTWSPTNTGSSNFRLGGAGDNLRPSDFWIEDTSYLRLKNVTVGYTFPELKGISRLRIYAAGENLFTITDYSGLDPEVANRGLDGGQYPVATTFSIGLNVGF